MQTTRPNGPAQAKRHRRRKQYKPRPRGERYIAIELWELESPAFIALSADAVRVYLDMRRHLNFDYSNNGQMPYSHRQAADVLHSAWRRGSNALAELEHYGFIKQRNEGIPGVAIRLAAEWQLTTFPCGGQEASKDFTRWDGTVFEPPYRRSEKQTPIGTVKTQRRHGEDAHPRAVPDRSPKRAKASAR
jgi:hypothetical protein